jgi:hypothetical protein
LSLFIVLESLAPAHFTPYDCDWKMATDKIETFGSVLI